LEKDSTILNLVSRLKSDIGLMLRRPPKQQYAALCYRMKKKQGGLEVLLLTSRDTGRWVIPKGWPMPAKKAHAVAEREAYEEAGVKGKVDKEPLGYYHYNKSLRSGLKILVRVQVHPLDVQEMVKNFPEKGSRKLEWVSPEEAANRVNEPELKALFSVFASRPPEMMARPGTAG
jgi:8-oxo-dGTP pyrophosphatase MutT (NUDIX family)